MRKQLLSKFGKAFAGAVLALVVAWACAGGVLWQAARIVHYHAVRWGEADEMTDTVRLTASSKILWIEEDELRFEGCMFDVQETRRVGEDLLLIGHFDRADDEIFQLLNSLFGWGSQRGEDVKRCAVFLPEGIVTDTLSQQILRVVNAKPYRYPAPAEQWRSFPQKAPEYPPEILM